MGILDRFGVWDEIAVEAVDLKETSIGGENLDFSFKTMCILTKKHIEGSTDNELAHVDLNYTLQTYGYPQMVGHRASLAGGMFNGCKREKAIQFHFAHTFESVKSFSPKPTFIVRSTGNGKFDVLLAADGIESKTREQILGERGVDTHVQDTGRAAYRIILKREEMASDAMIDPCG